MLLNMMLLPAPQYTDNDGVLIPGGKLYFYKAGTTTELKDTYADVLGVTKNANPIVLDSAARSAVPIWLDGYYNIFLYDANNVLIWSVDNVYGIGYNPIDTENSEVAQDVIV